jgi:hypothetical protein
MSLLVLEWPFYIVIWNTAGLVNGFIRVHRTMTLSESGDEYAGSGHANYCDLNWNVVFSSGAHVKGKRLETPEL